MWEVESKIGFGSKEGEEPSKLGGGLDQMRGGEVRVKGDWGQKYSK